MLDKELPAILPAEEGEDYSLLEISCSYDPQIL